jgi:DNA-binding NarL/FixJ family response regulator
MMSSVRILLVDDFEPWRRFVSSTLKNRPELQVLCEVSDGLEAVQKAQELQPDLILLDIGLPSLNGIEAARRIRKLSPKSKILFMSEKQSLEIAAEALGTDAKGYLIKSDAGAELLVAVDNVLQGEPFMSARLAGNDYVEHNDSQVGPQSGLSVDTG